MNRQILLLYGALVALLVVANSLFIWQFELGLVAMLLLVIKDIAIILAMRKMLQITLGQYFAGFTDNIINEQTKQIDLTVRLATDNCPDKEISNKFNHSISQTHDALMDIEASVSRLVPMSKELQDTYSSTTQKTLMQTNYSKTVANAMERMHQASTTVSSDISQINTAVVSSNEYVTSCRDAVDSTVQSIHIVSENMHRATGELEKLKQASEEVSTVIEVINSIAEQTNLLALNAAIEAARAGEMGRGFAVVADEVRTLAERTRVSTSEVRDNIERIQSQTNELVASMSEGRESTEETVQRSENSRKQLDEIFNAVEAIQLAADQINSSIEIQTAAANDTKISIEGLVDLNTDALESTHMHSVSKQDLHNLAQALKDKLSIFILNDSQWNESLRTRTREQEELQADIEIESTEDDVELF